MQIVTQKLKKKPSEAVARLHNRPVGNANATVLFLGSKQVKTLYTQRDTHSLTRTQSDTHTRGTLGELYSGQHLVLKS